MEDEGVKQVLYFLCLRLHEGLLGSERQTFHHQTVSTVVSVYGRFCLTIFFDGIDLFVETLYYNANTYPRQQTAKELQRSITGMATEYNQSLTANTNKD